MIVLLSNFIFFLKDGTGQSLGKKLLNIKLIRKDNFKKPSLFSTFISNLCICLGIIEIWAILSDKNNEGIGDKLTKTIVVKEQ